MKPLRLVAITALLLSSQQAEAVTQVCRVKPANVTTGPGGELYITGPVVGTGVSWQWISVCSVSYVSRGIPMDTCKAWTSHAMTALVAGKTLFMFYDDAANNNMTSCTQFPGWSAPQIAYLGMDQ